MASEKPDNSGFLAVIDAKIAALQQLRDSFIAAMSIGALGGETFRRAIGGPAGADHF